MKAISRTLFLLVVFTIFSSHELFLKSDSHFLSPNRAYELYLFNGTFDKSENEITTDRIINPKIEGPDYEFIPTENDFYINDKKTYLKFTTKGEGTYVSGISTLPKVLEMTAEDFNEYLEHEGLENTIAERKKESIMDSGAREKYSKHVKTLLQVGDKTSDGFDIEFGYPIEFIPMNNPFEIELGESVSFKLLRDGKPLEGQTVHYSTSIPGKDAHENENSTKTDDKGILNITPSSSGKWYVATIHMVESDEVDVDYESNWATFTFEIR